ncbi:MAG: hypothetical protein LC789_11590, partial [Actinobacteria bacterium]|nr:hypothetical protein [Actinomycetota bacterium]
MSRLRRPAVLVPLGVVGALVVAVPTALATTGGSLSVVGLKDGALVGAKAAAVRVVPKGVAIEEVKATVDGKPAQIKDGAVSLTGLPEGRHELKVSAPKSFLGSATVTRTFTVDSTPPALSVKAPDKPVKIKDAVTVAGTVEKGAKVVADGGKLTMKDTSFTVEYPTPPAGAKVVATDTAGNSSEQEVTVPTAYPSNIRAVHVTGAAWAYSKLRNPVLQPRHDDAVGALDVLEPVDEGALHDGVRVRVGVGDAVLAR